MIGGIKKIKTLPGKASEFEALFNQLKAKIRADEPGNVYFDLYRSKIEPDSYIVMERYIDQAALDMHKSSAHGAYFFPKIRAILEKIDVDYFDSIE